MIKLSINLIKPYRTIHVQQDGRRDVLYSWTLSNAMQWIDRAFNTDAVTVSRYNKLLAYRSPVASKG